MFEEVRFEDFVLSLSMKLYAGATIWNGFGGATFLRSSWSWSMKLKFEADVWSWNLKLKLKFKVQVQSWRLNLKFKFEEWSLSFKF